jgi:hypothetical protein
MRREGRPAAPPTSDRAAGAGIVGAMVRIVGLALLVLWVWSLAESLLTPRHEVRLLPKAVWVIAVVLGRCHRLAGPRSSSSGRSARGPDDDPDSSAACSGPGPT